MATGEQPLGPTAFRSVRDTREVTLDRPVFLISVACVVGAAVPMILYPDAAGALVDAVYAWIASTLGLLYHWATIFATVFLAWLAFSRHGKRVLGDGAKPEYGTVSWVGMLFCAGIGSGLLYWSTAEWASYMDQPPFGVEPGYRRGAGVGCHLRHFPLGSVGVVSVLPADRRDRVALLPVSATVPAPLGCAYRVVRS